MERADGGVSDWAHTWKIGFELWRERMISARREKAMENL